MSQKRKTQFEQRHQQIIQVAKQLLLESVNCDIKLDELAEQLGLAKGTLYKHFASKDELLLQVLIEHEKKSLASLIDDGASAMIARLMLCRFNHASEVAMMVHLEERLSASVVGLTRPFDELYAVRHACIERELEACKRYLDEQKSTLDAVDYLSSVASMILGGVMLLNSSFYQRFVGGREQLKYSLVKQALALPKLYVADVKAEAEPSVPADIDAVPKLIKPLMPPVV